MTDLIARHELVDYMERVYRAMEADMLAADNAAYLRGYKAALDKVRQVSSLHPVYTAAPDMAEALEAAVDAWETHCDSGDPMEGHWASDARAALAKARGK